MRTGVLGGKPPSLNPRRIPIAPVTQPGRWAVGLAIASVVLLFAGRYPLGFACGFAGGVAALFAIFRCGERAVAVVAALAGLAGLLFVVIFVIAELIIGHD